MSEMVYVGKNHLIGEVISLTNEMTTIQVYEETSGMKPGGPVYGTGQQMSVTLGPGILNNIFDGIERPLKTIEDQVGQYITKSVQVESLNTERKWPVRVTVELGQEVTGGMIIAEVQETKTIVHKSMIPPNIDGKVIEVVEDGDYTVVEPIVKVKQLDDTIVEIPLAQKWPIRVPRPVRRRHESSVPLITG